MRFKNLTYLFIATIYSANIHAAKLIVLSFYFSWLSHAPCRFFIWLSLRGYLVSISTIALLILKIIHKSIYTVTQKFPTERLRR